MPRSLNIFRIPNTQYKFRCVTTLQSPNRYSPQSPLNPTFVNPLQVRHQVRLYYTQRLGASGGTSSPAPAVHQKSVGRERARAGERGMPRRLFKNNVTRRGERRRRGGEPEKFRKNSFRGRSEALGREPQKEAAARGGGRGENRSASGGIVTVSRRSKPTSAASTRSLTSITMSAGKLSTSLPDRSQISVRVAPGSTACV